MSSVIVLSDSDEPASPAKLNERNDNESPINRRYHPDVKDDFDFPEVQFCYTSKTVGNTTSQSDEDLNASVEESVGLHDPGKSSDLNVNDYFGRVHGSLHAVPGSSESDENQIEQMLQIRKVTSKKDKIMLKEERLRRQQALAKEKALRKIALKKSKGIKPGECLKFMEVNLDEGIDAFAFQMEIKSALRDNNIKFNVTTELIPNSITWKRNIEESYIDENNEVCVRETIQAEQQTILIWSSYETVKHVAEDSFCTSVLNSKALIPNCDMTLVIFGIEEYFAYCKSAKHKPGQTSRSKASRCNINGNEQFKTLAIISRQQLETCLTEIQIIAKCSSRLIENAQDLALMVYQYTKSISEIPYKLQNRKNLESKFDWYVMGDNKNTVRVDKDGNGLKRLWQQQLCQFNLSSLETAEAICTVYSSPAQLIKAYKNCTADEGINLLRDIPIRRAAGPLTTVRKVGPELSKKIYTMFTSENGDTLLGTQE